MPPDIRRINLTWLVLCLVAVAGGIGFVLVPKTPYDMPLGWILILSFGSRALDFYQRLATHPRPARIDSFGVEVEGSGYGLVEWRDIESAAYWRASGRDWLALGVSDLSKYEQRLTTRDRLVHVLRPNFGPYTLAIDVSMVLEGGKVLYDKVLARLGRGRRR
jgi:hypothetical protein